MTQDEKSGAMAASEPAVVATTPTTEEQQPVEGSKEKVEETAVAPKAEANGPLAVSKHLLSHTR